MMRFLLRHTVAALVLAGAAPPSLADTTMVESATYTTENGLPGPQRPGRPGVYFGHRLNGWQGCFLTTPGIAVADPSALMGARIGFRTKMFAWENLVGRTPRLFTLRIARQTRGPFGNIVYETLRDIPITARDIDSELLWTMWPAHLDVYIYTYRPKLNTANQEVGPQYLNLDRADFAPVAIPSSIHVQLCDLITPAELEVESVELQEWVPQQF